MRLPPANRERYLELHRAVPPAIEAVIRAAHIRSYSIYVGGDQLFAYYEYVGTDHAADLARMADDPATQAWWLDTGPLQERLPGTPDGEQWLPLAEAWHLGDPGDGGDHDMAPTPIQSTPQQIAAARDLAEARRVVDPATR